MPEWLTMGLSIFIASFVVNVFAGPRLRRWIVRRHGEEAFGLGVRVVEGEVPGAGRRWRHGIAVVKDDGSVSWRCRVLPAMRLVGSPARRPPAGEWWAVSPAAEVHEARTGAGARVELAVAPTDAHRLQRLEGPS